MQFEVTFVIEADDSKDVDLFIDCVKESSTWFDILGVTVKD